MSFFHRGFLNRANATATGQTSGTQAEIDGRFKNNVKVAVERLPVGAVEERGKPEGYVPQEHQGVELDPTADHADDLLVVTRLPSSQRNEPGFFCMISGYMKRKVLQTPGFPKAVKVPSAGPAYRIAEVSGCGLGMFATRKLRMGDLIVDERPLMIVPAALPTNISSLDPKFTKAQITQVVLYEKERLLEPLVARMTVEDKEALLALHNSHKLDGSGPILGVVRTNGFGLGSDFEEKDHTQAGQYSGIFKDLSRVNHSCCPNATRSWSNKSVSMQLRAVRDIEKDEEITTSYTSILLPYEKRKADLVSYEVNCTCPACTNHTASDILRNRFSNRPILSPPFPKEPGVAEDAWIQPAIQMIADMEADGVQSDLAYQSTLHQIVNAYMMMGDERAADFGKKLHATKRAHSDEPNKYKVYSDIRSIKAKLGHIFGLSKMMGGLPVIAAIA